MWHQELKVPGSALMRIRGFGAGRVLKDRSGFHTRVGTNPHGNDIDQLVTFVVATEERDEDIFRFAQSW